jgi:hypothetical protein
MISVMLIFVGFFAWVYALVDALRRPAGEWRAVEQDKTLWVAVLFVTFFMAGGLPGALLYYLIPYRAFKRLETTASDVKAAEGKGVEREVEDHEVVERAPESGAPVTKDVVGPVEPEKTPV